MAKVQPIPGSPGNYLLARLPTAEYQQLLPHMRPCTLEFKQTLYDTRGAIDYAYFPLTGVTSALTVMENGGAIEVATVGREGMVGLPLLLEDETSPFKVIVQIAGEGLRIKASDLMAAFQAKGALRPLLIHYNAAFLYQVSQSVACNGLHTVQQRCCRWLLMTHDRVQSDQMPLTHEFLAIMLGVRRASISEVLHPLQVAGILRYTRGKITVLDREQLEAAACECYRVAENEYLRVMG